MALGELTITLDSSGHLSVETLANTLKNTLDMLRTLQAEFVEAGVQVGWEVVRLQMQSLLSITVAPNIEERSRRTAGRKIVKAFLRGVEEIEQAPVMPEHFNDDVLDATRSPQGIRDAGPSRPKSPSRRLALRYRVRWRRAGLRQVLHGHPFQDRPRDGR